MGVRVVLAALVLAVGLSVTGPAEAGPVVGRAAVAQVEGETELSVLVDIRERLTLGLAGLLFVAYAYLAAKVG